MLCSSDELIGGHQTHLCCDDLVVLSARDEGFVGNWDAVEDGYADSGGDPCWLRGMDEADDQLPEDFANRCVLQGDFTRGQTGVGEAGDPMGRWHPFGSLQNEEVLEPGTGVDRRGDLHETHRRQAVPGSSLQLMSRFKMCEIGERVYMNGQLRIRVSRPFQELSASSRVQSFCV